MSVVTSVILAMSLLEEVVDDECPPAVNHINDWLSQRHLGVLNQVDTHAGGYKAVQALVYMGAFNALDVQEFIDALAAAPWQEKADISLFIKDDGEMAFSDMTPPSLHGPTTPQIRAAEYKRQLDRYNRAESPDLTDRLRAYIRAMAPYQLDREHARLLVAALAEIERLQSTLKQAALELYRHDNGIGPEMSHDYFTEQFMPQLLLAPWSESAEPWPFDDEEMAELEAIRRRAGLPITPRR